MAENTAPKTDYGSNSARSKKTSDPGAERPTIQQISTGTVRKKGISAKFKENFMGDSAGSVAHYVMFDVIVPRVKDLLFDIIVGGSERSLFGSSTYASRPSRNGRRSQLVGKTDYQGISNRTTVTDERISKQGRSTHNFEEILIPNRGEAELIRDTLLELVDQYDSATVADLYDATGITTDHTDHKFGWTAKDLENMSIVAARGGGFVLDMPRPNPL